jgi:hypothetical protein
MTTPNAPIPEQVRTKSLTLRVVLLIAATTYAPYVLIHGLCLFGVGWNVRGSELAMLVPMAGIAVVFVCAPLSLVPRLRDGALKAMLGGAALVLLLWPTGCSAKLLRSAGFRLAAERAEPLIAAIERYRAAHGHPPARLDQLVPDWLLALPPRLPPLVIETGKDIPTHYHGNEWVLIASVPSGFLNFDQFLFFPNGAYPEHGYGGSLERIGRWAYVHE